MQGLEIMNRNLRVDIEINGRKPDSLWVRIGLVLAALSFAAILIGLFVFVILPVLGVVLAVFLGVFFAVLVVVLSYLAYIRFRWYWLNRRR